MLNIIKSAAKLISADTTKQTTFITTFATITCLIKLEILSDPDLWTETSWTTYRIFERRKAHNIGLFFRQNHSFEPSVTTYRGVVSAVASTAAAPVLTTLPLLPLAQDNTPSAPSPNIKLKATDAPVFYGKAKSWKTFKVKAKAHIYTCGLGKVLEDDAYAVTHLEKNAAVFHFLYAACVDGTASRKIDKFDNSKDGHKAWVELVAWYVGSTISSDKYVERIETDLDGRDGEKAISKQQELSMFLNKIKDDGNVNTAKFLKVNKSSLKDCIGAIHEREMDLYIKAVTVSDKTPVLASRGNSVRHTSAPLVPPELFPLFIKEQRDSLQRARQSFHNNDEDTLTEKQNIEAKTSKSGSSRHGSKTKKKKQSSADDDSDYCAFLKWKNRSRDDLRSQNQSRKTAALTSFPALSTRCYKDNSDLESIGGDETRRQRQGKVEIGRSRRNMILESMHNHSNSSNNSSSASPTPTRLFHDISDHSSASSLCEYMSYNLV